MRRFTGVEFGMFVLAALFIIVGAAMLIQPTESFVFHQAYRWARSSVEHVSKHGARVYGALSILLGLGLLWMVFYGKGKRP